MDRLHSKLTKNHDSLVVTHLDNYVKNSCCFICVFLLHNIFLGCRIWLLRDNDVSVFDIILILCLMLDQ